MNEKSVEVEAGRGGVARERYRGKWPTQGKAEGLGPCAPPLLPIIFPRGHRFLLRSMCVSLALALALAGKGEGTEGGVVWGAG